MRRVWKACRGPTTHRRVRRRGPAGRAAVQWELGSHRLCAALGRGTGRGELVGGGASNAQQPSGHDDVEGRRQAAEIRQGVARVIACLRWWSARARRCRARRPGWRLWRDAVCSRACAGLLAGAKCADHGAALTTERRRPAETSPPNDLLRQGRTLDVLISRPLAPLPGNAASCAQGSTGRGSTAISDVIWDDSNPRTRFKSQLADCVSQCRRLSRGLMRCRRVRIERHFAASRTIRRCGLLEHDRQLTSWRSGEVAEI